jgi:hypothetical protein
MAIPPRVEYNNSSCMISITSANNHVREKKESGRRHTFLARIICALLEQHREFLVVIQSFGGRSSLVLIVLVGQQGQQDTLSEI